MRFLDNNPEENEITEFKKNLALQENQEYLRDAGFVNKVIEGKFLNKLSDEEISKIPGLRAGEGLE